MIQVSQILSELYGSGKSVVGMRQPTDPSYQLLSSVNQESSSAVYLESGLVSVANIKECQDYPDINMNEFNTLIANYIKDAIIDACNLVFANDDKLEYGLLYNYRNTVTETLTNNTDFVGYEVNVLNNPDITALLNSLLCQFDAAGTVTIYLFHSSQQTAIQSQAVTLTEKNTVEQTVSWTLDTHKQYGGVYYIGYFTEGLTPKAIDRRLDNSYLRKQFKKTSFQPIRIRNVSGTGLPNIYNRQYEDHTYGLNFNISVLRDYTEYIIDNKNRFAQLIKYQFQANILKILSMSTRSNIIQREVNRKATIELNGILTEDGKKYSQGILRKLENEADKIYKEYINKNVEPTISKAL